MSDNHTTEESAHDVLAAEEFGVPAPDPRLHGQRPHDVLAAEEFGMPAPDPALNHGPVRLPDDPTGIAEPHDVLAAEEFALPAPRPRAAGTQTDLPGPSRVAVVAGGVLALVLTGALRRRRSAR